MSLHRTRVLVTSLALAATVTAGTLTATAQAAAPAASVSSKPAGLPVAAPDPAATLQTLGALGTVTQLVGSLAGSANATPAPSATALQSKLTALATAEQTLSSAVPAAPALPVGSPATQPTGKRSPGLGKGLPLPVPAPPLPVPVPSVLQTALAKLQTDAQALVTAITSADAAQILSALTAVATDTVAVVTGTVTALGVSAPV